MPITTVETINLTNGQAERDTITAHIKPGLPYVGVIGATTGSQPLGSWVNDILQDLLHRIPRCRISGSVSPATAPRDTENVRLAILTAALKACGRLNISLPNGALVLGTVNDDGTIPPISVEQMMVYTHVIAYTRPPAVLLPAANVNQLPSCEPTVGRGTVRVLGVSHIDELLER